MRKKLEELANDFVGMDIDNVRELSDTDLIVEIIGVLTEKVEELDGHGHTIC